MLKRYFKWISVFSLFVVIINQPLAAARLPCATMHSDTPPDTPMVMENGMMMGAMNHALHSSAANDFLTSDPITDNQAMSECCEGQACAMASCFLLPVMVTASASPLAIEHTHLLPPDYRVVYASAELVSLYRPPISR